MTIVDIYDIIQLQPTNNYLKEVQETRECDEMKLSIKATKLICQIDHELRDCNCAVKYGNGKSFISRSVMMENAIKAADDVSDWVYVHSQLLKFQAEHLTMQDIPVFKTYQAEVEDLCVELFNLEKKRAYEELKGKCVVSRLQQSYFVALLLMNFLLLVRKDLLESLDNDDESEKMPLEEMGKVLVEMILKREYCKKELQEIKNVMLEWQKRRKKEYETDSQVRDYGY